MAKTREDFLVGEAATQEGVKHGLLWLATWGDPSQAGVIVVPTKPHFRTSDLATIIGDRAGKALGQGKPITLPRGRQVRGYTQRTIPKWGTLGPTLALWPGKRDLDQLQDCGMIALCVVPWVMDHVTVWSSAVGAVDVLSRSAAARPMVSDPVVDQALASLTRRVNLSTGLTNPRDKTASVGMFRILKKGGHQWTGDEVMARAVELGWKATDARELGEMATGMMKGRRYRAPGAEEVWAKDILRKWREAASS